jgi:NitT/TauT family transport system ATP-binding protein
LADAIASVQAGGNAASGALDSAQGRHAGGSLYAVGETQIFVQSIQAASQPIVVWIGASNGGDCSLNSVHISLSDITKTYKGTDNTPEVHALGPVDLEIFKGEFFSIVGPSGCGKSTLLEIIAGLAVATTGKVLIDGVEKRDEVPEGVGVVFQEDASFPWLTVHDNIAFGLKRHGVDRDVSQQRIARVLDLVGLKDFAKAYPSQLSGGMRQRVSIARTLVLEPSLILLDEPFGALDQQTRLLMGDEILNIWRATGATILLITHSLDEAAMLSDRVGVMSARPGRFLEIIETKWQRDRDSRVASSEPYGVITARLWSLLRDESMKATGLGMRGKASS